MKRRQYSVALSPEEYRVAYQVGGGNVSRGCRKALQVLSGSHPHPIMEDIAESLARIEERLDVLEYEQEQAQPDSNFVPASALESSSVTCGLCGDTGQAGAEGWTAAKKFGVDVCDVCLCLMEVQP